jgi:acetyl-CoA carboxylase biotin carboxyl carrier protein
MSKQEAQLEKSKDLQSASEAAEPGVRERRSRKRQPTLEASVNMDELRELITLIQENGFAEFELEREGFRLYVRRDVEGGSPIDLSDSSTQSQPEQALSTTQPRSAEQIARGGATAPAHPGAHAQTAASEDQDLHMIPSPIVGTFYRSATPNADPFVKIGSRVEADTVVCIIEAMKLMNEIQAETSGEVAKIYVENGQPVEYGQPLFGIKK